MSFVRNLLRSFGVGSGRSESERSDAADDDEDYAELSAEYSADLAYPKDIKDRLIKSFPFEFEVVPGNDVSQRLAELNQDEDTVAILMGDAEKFFQCAEVFGGHGMEEVAAQDPKEIIKRSRELDLASWFRNPFGESESEFDSFLNEMAGEWPEGDISEYSSSKEPSAVFDTLTGKYLERAYIGIFPASNFSQIPAMLRWGGWNDCPGPEIHVAALSYWQEKYGAKLVTLAFDTVEMHVERRPQTREEAIQLASEQFAYCNDLVTQGGGSIEALASHLMNSDWWYFWWD